MGNTPFAKENLSGRDRNREQDFNSDVWDVGL